MNNQKMSVMIGAPLTQKIISGKWKDKEMKEAISDSFKLLKLNGYEVYSAHEIEKYGEQLRDKKEYVIQDVEIAKKANWYIGITDGTVSNGLAVELGVAASHGVKLILFKRKGSTGTNFLETLVQAYDGTLLSYTSSANLLNQLAIIMKFSRTDSALKTHHNILLNR